MGYTVPHSALQWRHKKCDGISNHQRYDCLLSRLYKRRSKKTSKLRVTGLCEGNSPVTGEFPHKVPVTRKMFPFDDVIMRILLPVIWSDHQLAGTSDNSQMYRAFASSVIKRQSFYSTLLNHAISARRSHRDTNIYECHYGD